MMLGRGLLNSYRKRRKKWRRLQKEPGPDSEKAGQEEESSLGRDYMW